ncbi:hypothetical protein DESPIG_01165 [Desulfovibrio piger ATCC 29098]|uniref:Uncharacterized protein n=1 Tax=Desulfovibrio piger ATCC 29098 TaxID=411464 RepID=B6WSW3_9BACT|nr:hypothetical protein DESPIG_01165 [Desulfovibrio piger ATCC 29098]
MRVTKIQLKNWKNFSGCGCSAAFPYVFGGRQCCREILFLMPFGL